MSMFDPFAALKKKKTNIFDFSPVSTQVPTQTPVNQYMTPIPKTAVQPQQAVKTPNDFGGFKTPDYGQGIFTPAQKNIFNSTTFQDELKNTPQGQSILKQEMQMVEGDTYDAAFRDIFNGMSEQELVNFYPDIPKEKQTALLGLAADIQNGMPADQLKLYKDLPTSFLKKMFYNKDLASLWKDNVANKEDVFGYVKGRTKQDYIDKGLDKSLTVNFAGNQANLSEGVRLAGNVLPGAVRLLAFFGNLVTNPKKTVGDLVGGIGDILLNSAYKLDDEGISAVPGLIDDLADAIVTNPELALGGEFTKALKMGGSPIAKVVKTGIEKTPTQVMKGASRAATNVPESPVGSVATKFISNTIESRIKAAGKELTPENIVLEANKIWKQIYGEDYTPGKVPGNQASAKTAQTAQVETPTDPTQPYNNGVDSKGTPTVRPQATRTKQVDTMIAQAIANTVRGMKNYGQSEKFKNSAVEGLSTLLDNRDAIPYIFDENGLPNVDTTKHTPVSQAISETKNDLWNTQIEPLIAEATQAGATIESIPIVQSISDTLQGFKLSNGSIIPGTEGAYNTMLKMANMFMDSDGNIRPISISDAQRISQALNKMAKPLYQGASAGDVLTMMAIDGMNRILRPMIDQGVELALDRAGLSELKRRRGALTNIEAPITKRGQVVDRQPQAGLFGGLSDLYGGSELAGSFVQLATGDIGGFVSGVVRAGATKLISRYLKNMNDRNRLLAKLMLEIDKQRKGFKIPGGYRNVPKATPGYRPMKGQGLPQGTPTPVGPNGPIIKKPFTAAPTAKLGIVETYAPGYKNPQEEAVIAEKKSLLTKKADEEKIKSETEAEKAKKEQKRQQELDAEFKKTKENGYQVTNSNTWKQGDVSPLGTLDSGIIMEGSRRMVRIDGVKYPELQVNPVYRLKKEIAVENFGERKKQYLDSALELLDVKSLSELPPSIETRVLEAVNQGARGNMGKLADKIDDIIMDYKGELTPEEQALVDNLFEKDVVAEESPVENTKKQNEGFSLKQEGGYYTKSGRKLDMNDRIDWDIYQQENPKKKLPAKPDYGDKVADLMDKGASQKDITAAQNEANAKFEPNDIIKKQLLAPKQNDLPHGIRTMNVDEIQHKPYNYTSEDWKKVDNIVENWNEDKANIIVDKTGFLQDGYHTLEATKRLGIKKLRVMVDRTIYNENPKQNDIKIPEKLYHGTLETFDSFDMAKAGSNTEYKNASRGIFFSDDPIRSKEFVDIAKVGSDKRHTNIIEAKVDIKNPVDLTLNGIFTNEKQAPLVLKASGYTDEILDGKEALEILDDNIDLGTIGDFYEELYSNIDNKKMFQDAGYDGIIAEMGREDGKIIHEYVAFDTKQIDITNKFPGNKENKEYNTPEKKPLLTKKPTDDGSQLQTKGGDTVGQSNGVKQVSLIEKKIPVESENKGASTPIQLKGGYSSDNVVNGDGYGTGLSKAKQGELNKEVIKSLEDNNFSKNPFAYTYQEVQKMLQYEGGGGVDKAEGDFSGSNDEFYTPAKIIDDMWYLAKKYGFKEGAKVLEPAAGTGRFIKRKPNRTGAATGMEIDKVSGTIAAITNPEATIKIGDFQDKFMDFTGNKPLSYQEILKLPKYDIVIGNPPYKLRTTKQRNLGDLKNVDRFEDYFMIRGLQSLNQGGVMVVIVPSTFLDKGMYAAKEIMLETAMVIQDAYRLPNKTFPNTDVGTDIIVFRKVSTQLETETQTQAAYLSSGERFKQNPTKVLGEIGERTNRFGKMEKYVKGTMEDVKISEPKNTIADLGPLTITNMVTGKQEIIPTPVIELPKKSETLGIQRQKSTKDNVSKITNVVMDIIESNGGLVDGYIKVTPEGYMPLYVEGIGNNEIAVAHTYIQNGDVMRDPEIVFKVSRFGELVAQTIQQDPFGIKEIKPTDDFLGERADNLREQGFVKTDVMTPTEMLENEKELLIRDQKELDRISNYVTQFPGTKKPVQIKDLEKMIESRKSMIDYIEKEKLPAIEKKSLLTKKTPVAEPTTTKPVLQTKPTNNKPSEANLGGLFDMPTVKETIKVADKILNPVVEKAPAGLSNRILGASNLAPEDVQGLLKYQANTNVLGEVEGVEYTENPALLNYMDGQTYVNYNYFSGDIYDKLNQLEFDKNKITPAQYEKQKKGLLEVLPEPQVLENMTFNVTNEQIMNTPTNEIHTVRDHKYDAEQERTIRFDVEKPMTIKDKFTEWLREDGIPSRARVSAHEIISYFEGRKLNDKERKGMIVEDANYYFDKFIKEALDTDIQESLVNTENIRNRSIADIDTSKVPFIIKDLSDTFRGSNLNFKEVQTNSAIKMALKGSYISSLGAGYGKTMVGILAMVWNMQNGFAKRPLIIVPKQTMKGREESIRAMFPTYKLNVLGSLDSKGRKIAYKERGNDVSKWIEDNSITLVTEEAYVGQMAFTDATTNRVKGELQDDMEAKGMSDKQRAALDEKNEADVESIAVGKAKSNEKGIDMSMYDQDRVKIQYENMQTMTHEQFIKNFVDGGGTVEKAKELLSIEPMYIEKMGFDMFVVDELHNFKNIFAKAKISETETGGKGKNMYGDVVGSTSKKGMKMMIGANYIQSINNGRGFLGLTATPFNNQAIEVYNIMNLVGRTRLKKMGITNMNDFMSNFSTFKEELVVQLGKTGYKSIQKGFVNLQSMQRLVNEHIDFKGDDPSIIKPELKKIYATLQMSDIQKELQAQIEEEMMDKTKPGAMIGGAQNARVNNISPYFTSHLRDSSFTPEDLLKNSPKLDFFADIVIENRKQGNKDLAILFLHFGKDLHGMLAEGLAKKIGIPVSRIGIINSLPKYKSKMFETINKANNGELDILIGGKTINEGVDLQHKTYILYDAILGWNPTEPVQKIARGRRQGNMRSHVVAIRPQLENSIDSFMFQKVEEKQARINDIFSGEGEVFDVEDVDPAEEKLALITDPIKKAAIFIEIEQRKLQRTIELVKGEISDMEKWKADIDEEINTLPNILANIEQYQSRGGNYEEYLKTMKKQAESIRGKAKRSRANIEKRGINLNAELITKNRELEELNQEAKDIQEQYPAKVKQYEIDQLDAISKRKPRSYYIDQIKGITDELKVFKTVGEQEEFKKSLLSKK